MPRAGREARRVTRVFAAAAVAVACLGVACPPPAGAAGLTTWDGRWPIERITATFVYFVPADRTSLPDWRERVEYFRRRIERFHVREFRGRSRLESLVHPEPFVSAAATAALRAGDANRIYGRTIDEVAAAIERPVPGAKNGGSRAVYLAEAGRGRGLGSGDGWRVPCRGSDCVVYHEGIGHAIGLPHPEQQDGSVMSLGQYRGWISESWVDEGQKTRLGWSPPERPAEKPPETPADPPSRKPGGNRDDTPTARATDLFSRFRALPDPAVPRPGQPIDLVLEWPADVAVADTRVEIQTSLRGPWVRPRAALATGDTGGGRIALGAFDRPCGVAYRARVATAAGDAAEVWGDGRVGALENVDGRNVQANPTRVEGAMLERGRPAQIVCTVRRGGVEVTVDGRPWIDWRGNPGRLSLSDYWRTPRAETLFLGAYDCRHRFTRVTLEPLAGEGKPAGAAGRQP